MKVVYELITENDKKLDFKPTKEQLENITETCEKLMHLTINKLMNSNDKITVKFKSISDYEEE